jgi:hypothetical protein
MIKAKVNGNPVEIETSWAELSFRKYLKLIEKGIGAENFQVKQSDVLSVMLDLPTETVQKADFQGLDPVLKALGFLYTMPVVEEYPKKVGAFEIPKDITHHSVEQFETMEKYIAQAAGEQDMVNRVKPLAMYCAIYCQPLSGDAFDEEKAQFLSERIMDYPCEEVMSVGTFFTLKFVSTKRNLPMSYLYKSIPARRKRRVFDGFLRRSGFTRLSTILRAIWASLTKRPSN